MTLTRRRFMAIAATAVTVPCLPAFAATSPVQVAWRGAALGAHASITLSGHDADRMATLINGLEAEVSRLENIFSIYRSGSQVSRLNRDGVLRTPAPELLELMSLTSSVHDATGGAFDPTVQTLWQLHAEVRALGQQPTAQAVRDARGRTGWQHVDFSSELVRFDKHGMALTFNGIAQGYVADRMADLLRANGFTNVLVDMGEISARGHRAAGEPWQVGIVRPDGALVAKTEISDRALATSAPALAEPANGMVANHIIDPRSGEPGGRWNLVSVSHRQAAVADALSTAFSLLARAEIDAVLKQFADARLEFLSRVSARIIQ